MKRIQKLVGFANEIFAKLGPGHTEYIYHRAMEVELRLSNIMYQSEVPLPIVYKNTILGNGRLDILVDFEDESIPIELKALINPPKATEIDQLKNYIIHGNRFHKKTTNRGIVINFPQQGKNGTRKYVDAILIEEDFKITHIYHPDSKEMKEITI